ncbi:RND superfamily putative drug exporter [Actinoplanes lutulentus]|uniref:RND superfamily putative drug exporter n=1 Tax=Actinoplanes lutulentus TaxID=1287878 RepID=A0A327Z9I1_9ACTN|nr:MMPL family transporter [Actinoplanes lutulentus]MBB2946679.1 RND superfamily putative drug exporter [Actinoplanes lutulentus]RAK35572.1 RND superfamily putative drug exporter [Actinoplanes lutulentus]
MAELLYRIGRFSARRAWAVLITWLVVLGLSVTAYFTLGGALSSQVSIPGTATAKVTDQLRERFPSASGGSGTIVFHTADGAKFNDDQRTAIGALLKSTGELDGVAATTDPFTTSQQLAQQSEQLKQGEQQLEAALANRDALPEEQRQQLDAQAAKLENSQQILDMSSQIRMVSVDDTTAVASIVFDKAQMDVTPETKEGVVEHVTDGVPAGIEADFSNEITQSVPQVLGVGEVAGLVVAAITLLVMLGAIVAAALPILTALVGVGVGVTASLALSGAVDMLSITPVLGVMLGLAVGIDYCLFILNRHRRQLLDGVELHESIALANGTSGNAVVFAGATVLVALLALNVTGIGFLGLMGTVGAICVAVAVVIAVTLTPALLALLGTRILTKKAKATIGQSRAGKIPTTPMTTGRALITAVAGLAVLVVLAIPALSMRLGLPDGSSEAADSTQYQAYQLIEEKFGAGVNGPLLVVAELPQAVTGDAALAAQAEIGGRILAQDNVVAVAPIGQSSDNELIAFQVVPAEGPNSETTEQLVRDLRDLSPLEGDIVLGVAGSASGNIDISEQLSDVLPIYLGVVLGLSLIILILVFRSILVPVTATIGFVLSLFATFGGITAIFQWGWLGALFGVHDPGPVLSFLPTILIGILFGLAMDYQLFLVSGMREAYAHGAPARLAVRQGLHAGRTVVTAAAIIMISVFGGFIFSHTTMIRSLGFGLAFGVLADAFLVRMLLIPAVMHLLGKSAWWIPRWLDRILPNVDVEGAALERSHPVAHPAAEKEAVTADR